MEKIVIWHLLVFANEDAEKRRENFFRPCKMVREEGKESN